MATLGALFGSIYGGSVFATGFYWEWITGTRTTLANDSSDLFAILLAAALIGGFLGFLLGIILGCGAGVFLWSFARLYPRLALPKDIYHLIAQITTTTCILLGVVTSLPRLLLRAPTGMYILPVFPPFTPLVEFGIFPALLAGLAMWRVSKRITMDEYGEAQNESRA